MTEKKEIQWVEVAGKSIPALHVICPECDALHLNTIFNTRVIPWLAMCPRGHTWAVNPEADA